jgi:hypothetical protein
VCCVFLLLLVLGKRGELILGAAVGVSFPREFMSFFEILFLESPAVMAA